MTESTLWWIATGGAIIFELLTGTFYILMLALGLVAAALAAHAGATLTAQLIAAAIVGGGAVVACYLVRKKTTATSSFGSNRDVNLDVGEVVQVDSWHSDGITSVKYRGVQWTAIRKANTPASVGAHYIVEVRGNQLVIEKREP